MTSPDGQSGDRRVSLLVLGAAAFMVASDARVIDPLLRTVSADFNIPLRTAALAVSAYAFPYGLGQLAYGPLGDRLGKVRVMAVAFSLFTLGTAACAFVPEHTGMNALIVLRLVTGIFAAAIIPLSIAYIGDKFSTENRQAMLGQFMSALMLGTVFSGPLGGIFGQFIGWRDIFLLLGGVSFLVAIAFWRAAAAEPKPVRDPSKPHLPVMKGYALVLSNPNAYVVLPGIFLEGLFLFGGFVYISSSLQDNFHLSILKAGLLISFYGIGGLIYSLFAKRILREVKQWHMAFVGGMLLMIGFVVAGLLPRLEHWWPIIPAELMMGFGFNSLHSTLQTKATELSIKARGTAVSLFAFFFFLGQSLGVQGGGYLGAHFGTVVAPDKILPAYSVVFLTSAVGLFAMAMWVAWRLPGMSKEQAAPSVANIPAAQVAVKS